MTDQSGRRRRRIWLAATAGLVSLVTVVPLAAALLAHVFGADSAARAPTSSVSTAPAPPPITPLPVRPVVQAQGVAADTCPPPPPAPALPADPLTVCDVTKTGLYTLGPEALQLQLTRVASVLSPVTNTFVIQVTLTPESARAFGDFTRGHIGQQAALVRGATVISAPKITEPIDGDVLQLSGDLTSDQSEEMVRLLRDAP